MTNCVDILSSSGLEKCIGIIFLWHVAISLQRSYLFWYGRKVMPMFPFQPNLALVFFSNRAKKAMHTVQITATQFPAQHKTSSIATAANFLLQSSKAQAQWQNKHIASRNSAFTSRLHQLVSAGLSGKNCLLAIYLTLIGFVLIPSRQEERYLIQFIVRFQISIRAC